LRQDAATVEVNKASGVIEIECSLYTVAVYGPDTEI
jgi:hypothetical protein